MSKPKWLFSITHYTKEIADILDHMTYSNNKTQDRHIKGIIAEVVITAYENLVRKAEADKLNT